MTTIGFQIENYCPSLAGSGSVCHVYPGFQGTHDVLILTKGYRVPGNQGTHAKLNQIQKVYVSYAYKNLFLIDLMYKHRETSRDALLEFIVSTENRSSCILF